jgi:hypothetical protein
MTRKPKPYGSLGLSGAMPRHKSEDEQKIEKILREEQDKEAGRNLTALQEWTRELVMRQAMRQAREATYKPLK